jgi:cyclic nucleotide gated channel
MFVVSCVIAVIGDPLFFYLFVINEDDKCITLDRRLKITAFCLRSVFDMVSLANIILELFCPYIDKDASRISGRTEFVKDGPKIRNRYMRSYFLIDFFAILPIPQVRDIFLLLNSFFFFFPEFKGNEDSIIVILHALFFLV